MKNNMRVSVSAPGKLILMGEHAVVYGYPSIVTAIDTRLTVTIEDSAGSGIEINAKGVSDTRFVSRAIELVGEHWAKPFPSITLTTESQFSPLYGFGSSSAVTVATVFALYEFLGMKSTTREIFEIAYQVVRDVQGVASGFDTAAAAYGGTLLYGDGGKTLESLSIDTSSFVIGYTGQKADTTAYVKMVREKKEHYPEKVNRIFQAIAALVADGKKYMLEGDWERVGKLFDFNQEYLRDLGVSSEKLETLIHAAHGAGAWGAKLSGAGGGDCMIAVVSKENRDAVVRAITQCGGEVMNVSAHAEGVRRETTDDQNELFIVVDTSDTVVGYKTRYECHHDKSLIHRTVGALIYNDKGEVLVQKRTMTKDMDPGLWGISCAGHVTKGQTDDEAVHRELNEELGVDTQLAFIGTFMVGDSKETERAALYKGIHNGPFTLASAEVSEVQFMSIDILKEKIARSEMTFTKSALEAFRLIGVLS